MSPPVFLWHARQHARRSSTPPAGPRTACHWSGRRTGATCWPPRWRPACGSTTACRWCRRGLRPVPLSWRLLGRWDAACQGITANNSRRGAANPCPGFQVRRHAAGAREARCPAGGALAASPGGWVGRACRRGRGLGWARAQGAACQALLHWSWRALAARPVLVCWGAGVCGVWVAVKLHLR